MVLLFIYLLNTLWNVTGVRIGYKISSAQWWSRTNILHPQVFYSIIVTLYMYETLNRQYTFVQFCHQGASQATPY